MPVYSGTPLPKKLGIKPGFRVYLANAPAEVQAELRDALAACEARRNEVSNNSGPLDFAMLFAKSHAGLSRQFAH